MHSTVSTIDLAYDERGSGPPVVFVHGLTFSRATWRPIVDRLSAQFRCVCVDLPGHGETPGPSRPLETIADDLHRLLDALGIEKPVVVGHSVAGVMVSIYAAKYPTAGVVNVDQSLLTAPFAAMVRQLMPILEGDFDRAFEPIRRSMGIELLPEPTRSATLATQTVSREVVLDSWRELIETEPADLQRRMDTFARSINSPYLVVMGDEMLPAVRMHFNRCLPGLEIEEWVGRGHMVHLAEPDLFAARVAAFVGTGARVTSP